MTGDLVAFLHDQYADEERIAQAAKGERIEAVVSQAGFVHLTRWSPDRVLAEIAAKRAVLSWHKPTGSNDPEMCGMCPHGRVIHPNDGPCIDSRCNCQWFDDDRELAYPTAARLCAFCGPGDTWEARDPEDFPHALWPCSHIRLLAQPYADHEQFREEWKT